MAFTPAEMAAIERMRQTRPADFDNDGHELAFPNRLNDTASALAGAGREIAQAGSDAQAATSSAQAAAADRAQTGKDATATAADRAQTGKDAQATAADRTRTGEDRTAIEAVGRAVAAAAISADDDAKATAADRAAVEAVGRSASSAAASADEDARATAQDRIATGEDRRAAAASARAAVASAESVDGPAIAARFDAVEQDVRDEASARKAEIAALQLFAVGDVLNTARNPGEKWLPLDGSIYLQSAYPALYGLGGFEGVGYDLDTAVYTNRSFSVAAQDGAPRSLFFRPDGTRMYVVGITNDRVYEYTLSTPWQVDTAVYTNRSFSVAAQDGAPLGLFFRPDGTRMYVVGNTNDRVYEYTLSTPWQVDTAVYTNRSFSVAAQDGAPLGLFFRPDGTRMYVVGNTNDRVYEYTLSTPWQVDTAVYTNRSFSVAAQETEPRGPFFRPDGTRMYVVGITNDRVYEYTLSTPWQVDTAVYTNRSFSVAAQDGAPFGPFFRPDGTRMYVVGTESGRVYEYTLLSYDPATEFQLPLLDQTTIAPLISYIRAEA